MRLLLTLSILLALTGCANTDTRAFYGQSFIGARLHEDRGFMSCSFENSGIRLGHAWRISKQFTVAAEYEHISHLLCGEPFNDKDEASADHIGVVFTYGGFQ